MTTVDTVWKLANGGRYSAIRLFFFIYRCAAEGQPGQLSKCSRDSTSCVIWRMNFDYLAENGYFRKFYVLLTMNLDIKIYFRIQLKCDGTRCRMRGEVKGKLPNAVGSQYPSHYLGTRCIQQYYRWCRTPRLPAVDWTDAPHRADLNGLVRFARKTKSGFCACDVIFKWTRPFRAEGEIWFLRMWRHI